MLYRKRTDGVREVSKVTKTVITGKKSEKKHFGKN